MCYSKNQMPTILWCVILLIQDCYASFGTVTVASSSSFRVLAHCDHCVGYLCFHISCFGNKCIPRVTSACRILQPVLLTHHVHKEMMTDEYVILESQICVSECFQLVT